MHMIEFLNRDRNTGVAKIFIDRDQVTAIKAAPHDSSIIFVGDHSFEVTEPVEHVALVLARGRRE